MHLIYLFLSSSDDLNASNFDGGAASAPELYVRSFDGFNYTARAPMHAVTVVCQLFLPASETRLDTSSNSCILAYDSSGSDEHQVAYTQGPLGKIRRMA